MAKKSTNKIIKGGLLRIKHLVDRVWRLDEYQRLSVIFLVIGVVFAGVSFYPFAKVFSGDWKINQQFSLVLWEPEITESNTVFNGTLNIRFYSIAILLAVFCGYFLALYLAKKHYVVSTIVDRLLVGMVVFGLIGARLFFVAFNWEAFSADTLQILFIYQGGLSFFGMFLAGFLYLWLYCARFKFNVFEFLDFLTPALLLGQVIGRFANFFNYESYGGPTSVFWKMYVPDSANFYENLNQKFFHPTFLYEIIPNFVLLTVLMWNYRKLTKRKAGLVFGVYAVGYGIIRFFVEFFRLDALIIELPEYLQFSILTVEMNQIRVSQLAALLLLLVGLLVLRIRSQIVYIRKSMVDLNVKKQRGSKV